MSPTDHEGAREELRRAMALHSQDRVDEALEAARRAVELEPAYAEAHAYLGNTLVTRKRDFDAGLASLERAVALDPDDVGRLYTLGWCQEFAAQALARGGHRGRNRPTTHTSDELYASAKANMLRAREVADPDDAIVGDIEDVLDYIAKATGEPWTDEERERAAPRPR
jgi:tetratricopeptide (TPR) repeat protein